MILLRIQSILCQISLAKLLQALSFPPSPAMLLHIPHFGHLQELLLLPLLQRAVIDFLAGVFHLREQASVLVRKACGELVEP